MIKNTQKSKEINKDMPKYMQYPGACGLTSLLMVLKPESRGIAEILDIIWQKIKKIFRINPDKQKEYNWQRTLEWLLFQVERNPTLQNLLENNFGKDLFDPMFSDLKYRIDQEYPLFKELKALIDIEEDYLPGDAPRLNEEWIMNRVNVWKEDFEIKIIANLFGCTFIPWEREIHLDGTGALYFTKKELRKNSTSFKGKMEFLLPSTNSGEPVLCCATNHWLAIKEIRKQNQNYIVVFHDPATASEQKRFLQRFKDVDRFYLFKFYPDLFERHLKVLKTLK